MKWSSQSRDEKKTLAQKLARILSDEGWFVTTTIVLEELASENRNPVGIRAANLLAQNGFEDMEQ